MVPDDAVRDALIGEFSGDGISGVWERPASGSLEVVFYFEGALPPLAEARIRRTFDRNGLGAPLIRQGDVGDADWTVEWRKGFTSFPVGRRFRVVPGWEDPPEGDARVPIRIEPGMAFGTGTHETTQLVLEALEDALEEDAAKTVFDLGAGSGLLAIAASKLGAGRVFASDNDPDAVAVARSNFEKNGVSVPVFVGSVDAVGNAAVDLVAANLTAPVVEELAGEIWRVLAGDGMALISGVLRSEEERVASRLGAVGLVCGGRDARGEWALLRVRKVGR